jgi:hypothetical protein
MTATIQIEPLTDVSLSRAAELMTEAANLRLRPDELVRRKILGYAPPKPTRKTPGNRKGAKV